MAGTDKIPQTLFEFGVFQLDPANHLLLRQGQPVPLPPKAFDTLQLLVEQRGRLLGREDLLRSVWPDAFVEENNLTHYISMLRKTLGEGENGNTFIETVPKLGYRFVAEVREVTKGQDELLLAKHTKTRIVIHEEEQQDSHEVREAAPTTEAIVPSSPSTRTRRWVWLASSAVIAMLATAAVAYLPRPNKLNERDSILLADFENSTGESVFDRTLNRALTVKLEESPFLNVVSEQQVRDTLRLMGRSPDEHITVPLARELCLRRGAKALLSGSISRLGNQYVVTLEASNCVTGDSLGRAQEEASAQDQTLRALGRTVTELRRKLGESLSSIQKFDVPLAQATTASLTALRVFDDGDELRALGKESDAIPRYEAAIELDPNFALAHARLAAAYGNTNEFRLAEAEIKKAYALRDRVTEREKLYILYHYYDRADPGYAINAATKRKEISELWRRSYPRDWYPYNSLTLLYILSGEFEKAVEAGREATRLNPEESIPYGNLAIAYLYLNRLEEAKTVCLRAIASKLDGPDSEVHSILYQIGFLQDDSTTMSRQVEWAAGGPGEDGLLAVRINAAAFSGRLREARELVSHLREIELRRGLAEDASLHLATEALIEAQLGNIRTARIQTSSALTLAHTQTVKRVAAQTMAYLGDSRLADELLSDRSSSESHTELLILRAITEINRNQRLRAVELLRSISDSAFLAPYYRGVACLGAHRYREAGSEFQAVVDHRGVALMVYDTVYPLALLGMARAQAGAGDTAQSQHSYQELLGIWKDADPDVPAVRQAKAEYAALH